MPKIQITSPVGRVVDGNLYDPQTTDAEGKPLLVKHGPNTGQPRVNFYFAIAVPKNPGETHWANSPWGQKVWNHGHAEMGPAAGSPAFAWKIEDGDSLIPNKRGRTNASREGYPGHWIIKLSGGFAPKVYQQNGTAFTQVMQKDFLKPGYFAEVAFEVEGNKSTSQPGVYLNHQMVCFRGYGQEIVFGPDVASAGFGTAPLPAGASMTPLPSALPPPAAAPVPGAPVAVAPPQAHAPAPVAPPPAGVPVAAAPVRQMTAAATTTYEGYIASGWTDALLVQHGLMLAPAAPVATPAPLPVQPVAGIPSIPPIPVTPNPTFLQVPPPQAHAPAPVAPPPAAVPVAAAPVRQMTAAATTTYEGYIASGWTDALLVQHGLMLA